MFNANQPDAFIISQFVFERTPPVRKFVAVRFQLTV